jgi:Uma2 family endonuclease
MIYTVTKPFTFDEFVAQYGDEFRYELADGELVDMEPTGTHEAVGGKIAVQIGLAITSTGLPWCIPRTCLIRPFGDIATARRPDVVVLDETALSNEPRWEQEPVITLGHSIKLGIPEYWIADFRGLGGTAFIGKPKQPTFTVCQLHGDEYQQKQYRLGEPITSLLFPTLKFRLDDVLPR